MKKHFLCKAAAFCISAAMTAGLLAAIPAYGAEAEEPSVKMIPMFRICNETTNEHFYTASTTERNYNMAHGWRYEGIGWYAPEKSNSPVYRVNLPGHEHHYTMSKNERDYLVAHGWTYEGIGWYSDDAESVPVYRQSNGGSHNYTISENEKNYLTTKAGWTDEGVGWYGVETDSEVSPYASFDAGDIITFGTFEQDNDTANGAEPIEWIVVDQKEEGTLLLSKYMLYASVWNEIKGDNIIWENSTMRSWLNDDFYNAAFSNSDKQAIVTAHNDNTSTIKFSQYRPLPIDQDPNEGAYGGNPTDDKVFLMSWEEAEKYYGAVYQPTSVSYKFPNEKLICDYTEYAATVLPQNIVANNKRFGFSVFRWWLRSRARYDTVIRVDERGNLSDGGYNNDVFGIRPMIIIK